MAAIVLYTLVLIKIIVYIACIILYGIHYYAARFSKKGFGLIILSQKIVR